MDFEKFIKQIEGLSDDVKMYRERADYLEQLLTNITQNIGGGKSSESIRKQTAKDIADWISFCAENGGYGRPIVKALEEISEKIRENYRVENYRVTCK